MGETNVVEHRRYDAFGELVDRENPTGGEAIDFAAFDFAYTGRPLDSVTGLYDYRARWYDAALGRFASEDPIGLAGGDVNLYRYVGNSPANGTDPSGLVVVPGVLDDTVIVWPLPFDEGPGPGPGDSSPSPGDNNPPNDSGDDPVERPGGHPGYDPGHHPVSNGPSWNKTGWPNYGAPSTPPPSRPPSSNRPHEESSGATDWHCPCPCHLPGSDEWYDASELNDFDGLSDVPCGVTDEDGLLTKAKKAAAEEIARWKNSKSYGEWKHFPGYSGNKEPAREFGGWPHARKRAFYEYFWKRWKDPITDAAKKYNLPPKLLFDRIMAEVIDFKANDFIEQGDSLGPGQLSEATVKKYGLGDPAKRGDLQENIEMTAKLTDLQLEELNLAASGGAKPGDPRLSRVAPLRKVGAMNPEFKPDFTRSRRFGEDMVESEDLDFVEWNKNVNQWDRNARKKDPNAAYKAIKPTAHAQKHKCGPCCLAWALLPGVLQNMNDIDPAAIDPNTTEPQLYERLRPSIKTPGGCAAQAIQEGDWVQPE